VYRQSGSGPYASTSTVASACEYALAEAQRRRFTSLAFAPMCTRGHAAAVMDLSSAEIWMPRVQAGTICSYLRTGGFPCLRRVLLCLSPDPDGSASQRNRRMAEAFLEEARLFEEAS